MNEQERSEMEWLKRRASRLAEELGVLGKQIENLEQKLNRTETKAPVSATPPPPSPSVAPTARIHVAPKLTPFTPVPTPEATIAAPTEIPPIIAPPPPPSPIPVFSQEIVEPAKPETLKPVAPESAPLLQQQQTPEPAPPLKQEVPTPPPMAPALAPRIAEPKEKKSFEMQLGTVWLVRVGIVMLITGLVFFGGYAYKTYVMNFGPTGKVSLLYLASGMLLGAGAWLQRKSVKESLNNFGQVVFAGGLAAVYFTTYAAHHFEGLRVIPSNWLDGTLLLLWAGFMVWVADRKKSEVMALFAILLAYYTAVITNVGLFTLYSNLVLTLAAVFFFLRNRWAVVSFTSLAGSYFSYAYWRFLHGGSWEFPSPSEGLWTGACFLIAYWALFSGAVFLSRHDKFKGESRASFLTINNGAFFTLFLLTMWQMHQGGFWKFALIYGGALLGLAVLARWLLAAEPLAKNTYLTQGLLLATAGAISHPDLGGLHLSLVLAVESVTLLMAGQMRNNLVLKAGAYIAAALAVGWGMDGMLEKDEHGLWLGMGLVILMLGNALWVERYLRERKSYLRGQISYFTTLALAVLFVVTHNNTSHANFPLVLAGEAALFILSIYILQVRELTVLGQLYL
ncbi:MAG TPA: DUF2339 domain-containing protein, partial [Candidatus Dormibacteraeota bacterium]|nr:DUF2339 domain-containing protein [Candidatus Dormibacteraeota bacterium]